MESLPATLAPWFATAFTLWGTPQTWLEVVAFVIAVAMVVFNMRVQPIAWPLAILSSALYGLLFWHQRLYASAALQLLFIVVACWGWWQWLRGRDDAGAALRVRFLGSRGQAVAVSASLLAWPLLGMFLAHYTDSPAPWLDAFPTAVSVVGQWLLARKYVDNWTAWIVANVVATLLYATQALWLTALLYGVLLVLAVIGWRTWSRMAQALAPAPAARAA